MKIHKSAFAIRHAITKEPSRYCLNTMRISDGHAQSTDGKIAFDVELADTDHADYPLIDGVEPVDETVMVSKDTAQALVKSLPKRSTLPVLLNAMVGKVGGKVVLITTDLEHPQRFGTEDTNDNWPNFSMIAPKDEPKAVTSLSVEYIIMLGKVLKEFYGTADRAVKLELRGEDDVIILTGENEQDQKVTVYLMPRKM